MAESLGILEPIEPLPEVKCRWIPNPKARLLELHALSTSALCLLVDQSPLSELELQFIRDLAQSRSTTGDADAAKLLALVSPLVPV
ncbi:MAG: hypothetical protein SH850_20435 [Planctomycetaceae bacterium]|nr:hypothetical protein [Planctomycetaceae bacterium]